MAETWDGVWNVWSCAGLDGGGNTGNSGNGIASGICAWSRTPLLALDADSSPTVVMLAFPLAGSVELTVSGGLVWLVPCIAGGPLACLLSSQIKGRV